MMITECDLYCFNLRNGDIAVAKKNAGLVQGWIEEGMIASKSTQRKIKTIPGIANQHAAPTRTPSLSAPITEVASKLIVDSIDSEIQFDNDIEMTDSEPSLVEAGTKRLTTMVSDWHGWSLSLD
jgi:hypothetical protein